MKGYHNVLDTSFLGRTFDEGFKKLLLFVLLVEFAVVSDLTLFGGRGADICFDDSSMPVKANDESALETFFDCGDL
jgi:hypothetical protein